MAMMSQTFEGQRLQASFTFQIVEMVKRIKINPMPRTAALPWGFSLAAGIIFTVMCLSGSAPLKCGATSPTSIAVNVGFPPLWGICENHHTGFYSISPYH